MLYESVEYGEFGEESALSKVPNIMSIGKVDSINYYSQQQNQR